MRAVHLSDLNVAVRTLMAVRANERAFEFERLLDQAQTADKYRKRTGRAHFSYGNGTLGAACQAHAKRPMPDRCDPEYLSCMETVIRGLLARRVDLTA